MRNSQFFLFTVKDRKGDAFLKCVAIFRPAVRFIKKMNGEERVNSTRRLRYLMKIGDILAEHVITLIKG